MRPIEGVAPGDTRDMGPPKWGEWGIPLGEQTFEGRRENLNQASKLSRTYATLLEALNRHRGKGHQKVTVEHVHVHSEQET